MKPPSSQNIPPHLHSCIFLRFCLDFSALLYPLQNAFPVLVQLQLDDGTVAGVNADWHGLPVRLLARDALDVDDVFQTVDGCDFAFTAFVGAAGDDDFVIFADGDGADL